MNKYEPGVLNYHVDYCTHLITFTKNHNFAFQPISLILRGAPVFYVDKGKIGVLKRNTKERYGELRRREGSRLLEVIRATLYRICPTGRPK